MPTSIPVQMSLMIGADRPRSRPRPRGCPSYWLRLHSRPLGRRGHFDPCCALIRRLLPHLKQQSPLFPEGVGAGFWEREGAGRIPGTLVTLTGPLRCAPPGKPPLGRARRPWAALLRGGRVLPRPRRPACPPVRPRRRWRGGAGARELTHAPTRANDYTFETWPAGAPAAASGFPPRTRTPHPLDPIPKPEAGAFHPTPTS